ncbi:Bug family tripartite tricarboxylate transporter substrate binding protein [Comamonas endophytica]
MFKKILFWGAALAMAAPSAALAQYPERPVKLVVGFSAGGPTDIAARLLAKHLGENLKQPFVIDNKAGAGGNLATNEVARSRADGYTGMVTGMNLTINPFMTEGLKVDSQQDFEPVRVFATSPTILVVRKDFPAENFAQFLQELKKNPGKYDASAQGASPVLAIQLFKTSTGTDISSIPYKGAAPAMIDLVAGHVDLSFASLGSVMPYLQSGKLKALAIAAPARHRDLPQVQTFTEVGMPDFRFDSWVGLLYPKGTPPEVLQKVDASMARLVGTSEFAKALDAAGMQPVKDSTPASFKQLIDQEMQLYKRLAAGLDKKG